MMEMKILLKEKNVLELELGSADQSLGQLLAEKLNADKDVEFAASKVEHPILGRPKLFVRTKKGDPAKLVIEKLEEIRQDVSTFRKDFAAMVR